MHDDDYDRPRPPAYLSEWQRVLRDGLLPLLSHEAKVALRDALARDDARLIQGGTTTPPPLACVQDWKCEGACLVGFCGLADGLETVGEIEQFFGRMCWEIDQRVGEPAGVRHLLNYFDNEPRPEVFAALVAELDAALSEQEAA